jgi:histidine phosphotransferase ChpT
LRLLALCPINPPMNPVDLASLLCSRLCHDLMSPVGALNNGIELLADEQDPDMRDKCMELLAESARASANKLKFFRLAFGAGGGFGESIDTREAQTALEGLFGPERRIELGWMVSDQKLAKRGGQAVAEPGDDCRRRAGARRAARRGRGEQWTTFELVIRAEGPRLLLDPSFRETLQRGRGPDRSNRALPAHGSRTALCRKRGDRCSCPIRTSNCC